MVRLSLLLGMLALGQTATSQQAAFEIQGNEKRCRDSVYRFVNQSTGATSYVWDFGDGSPSSNAVNPTHAYTSAGNYIVTLQASSGGNVSVTRKGIHVKNVPNAYFYVNYYGVIYPGTELRFENNSNNAESQRWTLGDGKATPMLHPRHAYAAAGIYDVRLAVYNGCGDSAEYIQQIEVTDTGSLKPIASMGVGGLVHCPNTSVEFYNYAEHFDRLVWDFGDGTRSDADEERVYHRFGDTGSYTVKLYAYRGAKVDSMVTVLEISTRKLDMPTPSFWPFKMLGGSYVVGNCVNQPVGLRMYYSLGEGSKTYWRISDGRVLHATDTTVTFADTGNYRAWFVLENACGAKDSSANWIYIRSSNTFGATPVNIQMTPYTGYVCPGGVIRFAAPYDYDADVSWNWEINGKMFYDTSLVVYRVPSKDTAFMVTLYRVPQCGAPSSSSRMVFASSRANPSADFMVESYAPWAGPMCYRDTLKLNANTGMNADNPVTHFWDFGDGSTSTAEAPVHVFSKPGWHTVLHAATNSCGIAEASVRTFHTQSNVAPLPRFYAMPSEVCFGDSVMFDNFTMGADSMVLDYGDGTRDTYGGFSFPHIFHTYQNPGRYTAQLYVYNGCAGDTARTVVLVREPLGAAIRMADTLIAPGSTLEFSFMPGRSRSHLWYRSAVAGDTSSALTFSKRYDQEGQFNVHLFTRGAFGCTEWDSVGIRVAVPSRVVLHEPDMFRAILYPNPTAGAAQLKLHLQQAGTVRVHLYDLNGRSMASLQEGHLSRGPHHFEVPTANLSPGMYLLRIQAGGKEQSLRILRQ